MVRITRYGHSCLLVEDGDARVLLDPGVFSTGFEQLRGLTAVLVTHQHPDHLDVARLAPLLAANPDARLHCDEGSVEHLAGLPHAVVADGDVLDLGTPVRVHGALHAVIHPDLPRIPNVGYLVGDGFFTPGDAMTVPDADVRVLGLPTGAPWLKALRGGRPAARRGAAGRLPGARRGAVAAAGLVRPLRQPRPGRAPASASSQLRTRCRSGLDAPATREDGGRAPHRLRTEVPDVAPARHRAQAARAVRASFDVARRRRTARLPRPADEHWRTRTRSRAAVLRTSPDPRSDSPAAFPAGLSSCPGPAAGQARGRR